MRVLAFRKRLKVFFVWKGKNMKELSYTKAKDSARRASNSDQNSLLDRISEFLVQHANQISPHFLHFNLLYIRVFSATCESLNCLSC